MSFWNTTSTTLENDQVYVNNTYKNANGDNALTTRTTSNPGGYTSVNPNSSDPIVKDLAFAVQKDGKITYIKSGSNTVYNSIQEIANGGLSGYSSATTLLIKDAMQKNLTASLQEYNTANPTTPIGPSVATAPEPEDPLAPKDDQGTATSKQVREAIDAADLTVSGEIPDSTKKIRDNYGNWFYPFEISSNKQDRIQFTMKRNVGSEFNLSLKGDLVSRKNPKQTINGSVTLAVQPSITDSNSVDWGGSNLNPLQALAAGASMQLQQDQQIGSSALPITQGIAKDLKEGKYGFGEFFKLYLAGEAASVQNLLSRATGAVINPNLELLFNGPQLRPFNFTFRLSPRDETEATNVKQIIRFFKQGMSIKTSASDVFLKSPNLFDIRYLVDDTKNEHPSIGRIKTCALIGCDVDYTPDGSYMTFSDVDRTMTSYQLSLRFSEVDPVYESDYYDSTRPLKDYEIGY